MSRFCLKGGLLVGARGEVPGDAAVCFDRAEHPVGCNRIKCSSCGVFLKDWPGFRLVSTDLEDDALAEVYATSDPEASRHFTRQFGAADYRAYACRCACDEVNAAFGLQAEFDRRPAWACGGH